MRADKQLNVVCCKCGQSHSGQSREKLVIAPEFYYGSSWSTATTTAATPRCVCVLTRIGRPFGEIQLTVHTV